MLAFAHRGGCADAPDNSLQAFRLALSRGVTALETDAWLDASGEPVLSHDRPRSGALPLRALLAECGVGFDLCVDLKAPCTAGPVVAVAREAGLDLRRLWLVGRGRAPLAWRDVDPDVRLVTDTRVQHALPVPTAYLRRLHSGGVQAVNLRRRNWSTSLVERVHAAGLLAFAWDVQTVARRDAVRDMGVDGFFSDHLSLVAPG